MTPTRPLIDRRPPPRCGTPLLLAALLLASACATYEEMVQASIGSQLKLSAGVLR
jgi:hypothetical protein